MLLSIILCPSIPIFLFLFFVFNLARSEFKLRKKENEFFDQIIRENFGVDIKK